MKDFHNIHFDNSCIFLCNIAFIVVVDCLAFVILFNNLCVDLNFDLNINLNIDLNVVLIIDLILELIVILQNIVVFLLIIVAQKNINDIDEMNDFSEYSLINVLIEDNYNIHNLLASIANIEK